MSLDKRWRARSVRGLIGAAALLVFGVVVGCLTKRFFLCLLPVLASLVVLIVMAAVAEVHFRCPSCGIPVYRVAMRSRSAAFFCPKCGQPITWK